MLECAAKMAGTWSYLAAIGPSTLAALVFAFMSVQTRELQHKIGAIWWLIPLEAIRNVTTAYDNFFWLATRVADICWTNPTAIGIIDHGIKVTIGLTAMISMWIYHRIRSGQ